MSHLPLSLSLSLFFSCFCFSSPLYVVTYARPPPPPHDELQHAPRCAFLEYPDRPTAEAVAASVGRSLVLQTAAGGKGCPFDWAKPKKADKPEAAAKGAMLPPPGMERAAVQAYRLVSPPPLLKCIKLR